MKQKAEFSVGVLRMIKTLLYNKTKELGKDLTQEQSEAILSTMVKQRRDSIEQFAKGGREELAEIERREIAHIELYLPIEASTELIDQAIQRYIAHKDYKLTMKEFGQSMKDIQADLKDRGFRVDGKVLSEKLKATLA
jgi:uncharacterized protein YqeY